MIDYKRIVELFARYDSLTQKELAELGNLCLKRAPIMAQQLMDIEKFCEEVISFKAFDPSEQAIALAVRAIIERGRQ